MDSANSADAAHPASANDTGLPASAEGSLAAIFAAWPSAQAMADDIGVPGVTVRQWRNRSGLIPTKYWPDIQAAAQRRGHVLPLKLFLPSRDESRSEKAERKGLPVNIVRMMALTTAVELLGGQRVLAEVLGIDPRSLRAKLSAERGVSDDDLTVTAQALNARASRISDHAAKLLAVAGQ